ncbi:2-methyl-6-phytyl-1,4-hydroquinone methyltransferase [Dyadobacter sp. CECT 9275]|uniref:2-methyl-6-phytyl-1,4-hydroquinone methyltransferase n=2 Tax=Dyadobacter helix TaxID=2822344 RepID=A0A916J8P2_9BACT|nr:2-methyl-6-phytyl-1,4-hydroquinone methyltransferase [Dyadobacter sp. CECT 9275]
MHYGYWEKDTRRLRDALINMNEKVAEYGKPQPGQTVADLGCGVGGPAIYLARKYRCHVTGLSLSESQISQASELAHTQGADFATFKVGDYCNTGFENASFNLAYAIESACYATDKSIFLDEAFRILKPEGKLIVIDFFWAGSARNQKDREIMKKWTDSWAIADYAYENDFEDSLRKSGFSKIQKHNCNLQVWPSIKRLYYCYYPGVVCDFVLRTVGLRGKVLTQNMQSAYYQYAAFQRGLWNYNIYVAEKS